MMSDKCQACGGTHYGSHGSLRCPYHCDKCGTNTEPCNVTGCPRNERWDKQEHLIVEMEALTRAAAGKPPRLRHPGESDTDYRVAMGWDKPKVSAPDEYRRGLPVGWNSAALIAKDRGPIGDVKVHAVTLLKVDELIQALVADNLRLSREAYTWWEAAVQRKAPASLRRLTLDEACEVAPDTMMSQAERIQHKFCEVNGLPSPGHSSGVAPPQPPSDWLLFEHDDGRFAAAPNDRAADFTRGDPAWHRAGLVTIHGAQPSGGGQKK